MSPDSEVRYFWHEAPVPPELEAAPGVLGWGEPAVLQARAAARVALTRWQLPVESPAEPGYAD